MDNNLENELILERAMVAFKCETQEQLADLLKISPQNLSKKKRTGAFKKLIKKEAYKQNKNYNWIETGQGEMLSTPSNHIAEQNLLYATPTNNPSQAPDDLLRKAAKVLRSNSSFRTALDSNIQSFHEAIELREDLDIARAELKQCQIILTQQTKLLGEQRVEMEKMKEHINKLEQELLAIKSA